MCAREGEREGGNGERERLQVLWTEQGTLPEVEGSVQLTSLLR